MSSQNIISNVKKNYFFTFLSNMTLTGGFWMIYLAFRGLSLTEIGLLEGIFHITSFGMEVPTGAVADIFGRKASRIAGRFFSLASAVMMIYSNSFLLFALAFVFSALSYNLESGAGDALVYDSLKYVGMENKYMRILGKQEAIFQATSILSLVIGGWIGSFDYFLGYSITAAICVLNLIFCFSFVEPPLENPSERGTYDFKNAFSGLVLQTRESFLVIKNNKKLGFLILSTQTIMAFCTSVFFYVQNYWKNLGFDEFQIGFFLALGSGITAIIATQVHRIEKILKESGTLVVSPLIAVICIWGIAFTEYSVFFYIITSVIESIIFISSNDYVNKMLPSKYRATVISFSSMVFSFMMIVVFPLFGNIAENHSFKFAFSLLAACGSVLFIINTLIILRFAKKSK